MLYQIICYRVNSKINFFLFFFAGLFCGALDECAGLVEMVEVVVMS